MRLLLSAGYDRAAHVLALAELATRAGHEIAGILVVNPFGLRRLRRLVRQRGHSVLVPAARRLRGLPATGARRPNGQPPDASPRDALQALLADEHIEPQSLRAWARAHGVLHALVPDLNAPATLALVRALAPDGMLYGGGGILRPAFLVACGGKVLNAHAGPLPEVRGMNACEWSLLLQRPPEVSIHFIDAGIDTGPLVARLRVPLEPHDDLESLRARCVALGVRGLLDALPALLQPPPAAATRPALSSRQCYVLAPVLRELLELRLRQGRAPTLDRPTDSLAVVEPTVARVPPVDAPMAAAAQDSR